MRLNFRIFNKGLRVKCRKGVFALTYPRSVWSAFSKKEKYFFADNAAYLNTACLPLVSGAGEIKYNTSMPIFKDFFDQSILKDLPSAVEEHEKESTEKILARFNSAKRSFSSKIAKTPVFETDTNGRAVVTFSAGKDTLLSLAVCREAGLDPVAVYINDTVSPSENRYKINATQKLSKEHNLDFEIVSNTIERLNDFELWDGDETEVGYSHMIQSFCFLSIPLLKSYNAGYVIMGNELDLNNSFVNKEGIVCYPSYDQSFEGTKKLNNLVKQATHGKASAGSVISPLHDLAIMRVLHKRYPSMGKYQFSCTGLDASRAKRWCSKCPDCVKPFLYSWANNISPKKIGINQNLFNKKFLKHHVLFNAGEKGRYEKSHGDEQVKFGYYLAYKNGAKGYIIDLFKKRFLKEVREKEDKLYRKYYSVHSAETIPKKIRQRVVSIYKEELSCF
ncbi:hypothetical protein JW707_04240 [Candidatus Woesearchaeota archaeon]|nr:hypothetical protein [Candidatus Woesearchaeota archaeon]